MTGKVGSVTPCHTWRSRTVKFRRRSRRLQERKTALYWAVEKSHVSIVRSLLNADPNLEIATKDGDTPLLRAVRNRHLEIVQMLLDKKARVTAADRAGDTALHIAMRARSKASHLIVPSKETKTHSIPGTYACNWMAWNRSEVFWFLWSEVLSLKSRSCNPQVTMKCEPASV